MDAHRDSQEALLNGIAAGKPLAALADAVGQYSTRGFSPDVAMLEVAMAAMDRANVGRDYPLRAEQLSTQHLPELTFKNKKDLQERVTFAIYAAAAMRAGLELDLFRDTYWWNGDPLWRYATYAAVAYVRACAGLVTTSVSEFAVELRNELHTHG